jgi:hypothetical protein
MLATMRSGDRFVGDYTTRTGVDVEGCLLKVGKVLGGGACLTPLSLLTYQIARHHVIHFLVPGAGSLGPTFQLRLALSNPGMRAVHSLTSGYRGDGSAHNADSRLDLIHYVAC